MFVAKTEYTFDQNLFQRGNFISYKENIGHEPEILNGIITNCSDDSITVLSLKGEEVIGIDQIDNISDNSPMTRYRIIAVADKLNIETL
jgi:hypothetical protein